MMKAIHMRLLKLLTACLVIVTVVIVAFVHATDKSDKPVVNVVIVGGTGDLAKKYLWQGFFNLYQEQNEDYKFRFVGAARMPASEGAVQLSHVMQNNVSCAKSIHPDESCPTMLNAYKTSVSYRKLKTANDYATLCSEMTQEEAKEHGRLFYLSVPPFAYAGIAENIAKGCRPGGSTWLRVVLEKPFGHDLASAEKLASQLSAHLREEEIYRIDHYLGKIGVQSILPFRSQNRDVYDKLWNREHIERVEIVMKEKLDCKGRLEFYDEYGVIRDVMQNHLTEIFALVAMETPVNLGNRGEFLGNKIRLLNRTQPCRPSQAVIGQYAGYNDQWHEELRKGQAEESVVPTFAATAFYVDNPQWKDIPFVMIAGKKLDERIGYVRIVLRQDLVCVTNFSADRCSTPQQIIFYTGNPGLKYPTILVSKQLPKPKVPESWFVPDSDPNSDIFGGSLSDFYYFSPPKDQDAYTSLIASCFHGNQQAFVGTGDLMASWRIWSPLLKSLEGRKPRLYSGWEDTGSLLDFRIRGRDLMFIHDLESPSELDSDSDRISFTSISDHFRSHPLITGSQQSVIAQLAKHLLQAAVDSIAKQGSFHIAVPGGSTPKSLFAYLATELTYLFPWADTHFWMVDERCVPLSDQLSNFKQLHDSLLQYVSVPFLNINPMPVKLAGGFCNSADKGPESYQDDLKRIGRLDYVLLGMGADGHIASLFPHHPTVGEKSAKVVLSNGGPQPVPNRMTLTLPTINQARHVGILILGKSKRDMVSVLKSDTVGDTLKYPVTGIHPDDGNLVWYIDHEALI